MRVAVLADIHGNLPALDAVLRDVDHASVDVVVLNGDIADGPMPRETLDRLIELGERAVWVRGNTDRWLVDAFDGSLQLAVLADIHGNSERRMVLLVRTADRPGAP
jgi:3',5'-cyclic AMP phosphodiesterase CpdA